MSLTELETTVLGSVLGSWSSILLLVVVLLTTWMYYSNPARRSPPGPTYIPLIGSIPFLFEAFSKRIDIVDRNNFLAGFLDAFENFERNTAGIGELSGHQWKVQRRFTLQMMRDFGMGKLSSEDKIVFEASEAIQEFKQHVHDQPFDPRHIVTMAVSNIANQFIYGKRFTYTDKKFLASLNCMSELVHGVGSPVSFLIAYKLGRFFFKSKFEYLKEMHTGMMNQVIQEIEEHKTRFDGSVNDMIDAYLAEMETNKDNDDFTASNLINLIRDLFIGGSDTSSTTLLWAILEMAIHQNVQEKVYLELKRALGPDKCPTMSAKKDTPYTEAVLCEIQRNHTLFELGVPHANISQDVEINGHIIPRDTMISANLFAIHRDPKFWKKPDEFYPENFMDGEEKVANLDRLNQFCIGRRSCAGEALARTELYIFFATWMKNLHFKLETDDTVPDMRSTGNILKQAYPFSVRVYPRP